MSQRLVSVELKDQDFTQALETVAGQVGARISFHGKKPEARRDIVLSQVPMGEAISRIMRLYGVQNHAAAYNPESGTIMLAVLGSHETAAWTLEEDTHSQTILRGDPLTVEQFNLLVQDDHEIIEPLTLAQLNDLSKSDNEGNPLTPEQLQSFETSDDIELFNPLTSEQMWKLDAEDQNSEPLSPSQMQQLDESDNL